MPLDTTKVKLWTPQCGAPFGGAKSNLTDSDGRTIFISQSTLCHNLDSMPVVKCGTNTAPEKDQGSGAATGRTPSSPPLWTLSVNT